MENLEEMQKEIDDFRKNVVTTNTIAESLEKIQKNLDALYGLLKTDTDDFRNLSADSLKAFQNAINDIKQVGDGISTQFSKLSKEQMDAFAALEKSISDLVRQAEEKLEESYKGTVEEVHKTLSESGIDEIKSMCSKNQKMNRILLIVSCVSILLSVVLLVILLIKL